MPFRVLIKDDASIERLFVRFLEGNRQLYEHYCSRANVENTNAALTRWERLAIWIYSTTNEVWFREINDALRDGYPSNDIQAISHILTLGLQKLHRYVGTAFRGIRVGDFNHFLTKYAVGTEIEWASFSSASIDSNSALVGNVSFIITSQNARILGLYADNLAEREVVFLPNSRFRVDGLERTISKAVIDLTELAPSVSKHEGEAS